MAKITDFTNPLTGQKGNVFDLTGIWNMILGVVIFLFVFAMGQNVANKLGGKVPMADFKPENPFSSNVVQTVMAKEVI